MVESQLHNSSVGDLVPAFGAVRHSSAKRTEAEGHEWEVFDEYSRRDGQQLLAWPRCSIALRSSPMTPRTRQAHDRLSASASGKPQMLRVSLRSYPRLENGAAQRGRRYKTCLLRWKIQREL